MPERQRHLSRADLPARGALPGLRLPAGLPPLQFQWLERDKYREQATRNHQRTIEVPAQRGSIFDANGNPLAVTIQLDAVSVTGRDLKEPKLAEQVAIDLGTLLGMQPRRSSA